LARLGQPRGFELDDASAERGSWDRVEVVEFDDAVRRDAVVSGGELELGDESPDGPCDCGHNDGSDAISS
jgi:hypothetical protein